jgi:hypothetical protein
MRELIKEILHDYVEENLLLERSYYKDELLFNRNGVKKLVILYNDHSLESIGKERVPIEDIMELIYEYKNDFFYTVVMAVEDKKDVVAVYNYHSYFPPYDDTYDIHFWLDRPEDNEYVVTINSSIYHNRGSFKPKKNWRTALITPKGKYVDNDFFVPKFKK